MDTIFKRPWIIIILILLGTLFFSLQLPNIQLDNDVMNMVPEDLPERKAMAELEDIFGGQLVMSVGIKVTGRTIFSKEITDLLLQLTEEFQELQYVDSVSSLGNIDYVGGTAEGLEVSPLVPENFSGNPDELFEMKSKLLSWDVYEKVFYSEDFKSTQIIVTLVDSADNVARDAVYFGLKDVMEKYKTPGVEFYVAGLPAITVVLTANMGGDLKLLIPFVVVIVILVLLVTLKRVSGVLLPLATVIISTIWTLGLMSILEMPLSMVGTIIPVLMIAVGSAYGIHIVSHYFDDLNAEGNSLSEEEHRKIVFHSLKKVGKPVLLAGLTTIVGFGALAVSEVLPMKIFGIFTAVGVLAASIVALTFIPAILLIRHSNVKRDNMETRNKVLEKVLLGFHKIVTAHKGLFLCAVITVTGLAIYGMNQVVIDNIMVEYFKENTEIRKSDTFLREKFAGTQSFNVMFKGSPEAAMTDPAILKTMDDLKIYLLDKYEVVGSVNSFADLIKQINKVMHYDSGDQVEAPADEGTGDDSMFFDDTSGTEDSGSFFTDESADESGSFFSDESTDESGSFFSDDSTEDSGSFFTDESGDSSGSFFTDESSETPVAETPAMKAKPAPENIAEILNRAYVKAGNVHITAKELIEYVNRELNHKGADFYEIPTYPAKYAASSKVELKNLIDQYLLLFSGNIDQYTDNAFEPTMARMMVTLTAVGNRDSVVITEDIRQWATAYLPEGYEMEISGTAMVQGKISDLLTGASIWSLFISLVIVFFILTFFYKSPVAGIIGIIPLAFSILINYGIMGFTGIKLNIATAMIGSIAIGIGIDYTIHFLSSYHYERRKHDDLNLVTKNALLTSGKAIIFNAISVAAGFAVLLLSNFGPIVYLGLLVALTMLSASFASMTIIPLLLNIIKPKFIQK